MFWKSPYWTIHIISLYLFSLYSFPKPYWTYVYEDLVKSEVLLVLVMMAKYGYKYNTLGSTFSWHGVCPLYHIYFNSYSVDLNIDWYQYIFLSYT